MTPHVGVEKENLSQEMEVPLAFQVCEPHFLVGVMGVGITYFEVVLMLQPSDGVKIEVRASQGGEEVKGREEKRGEGSVVVWVSVKKPTLVLAASKVFSLHSATLLLSLKPSLFSLSWFLFHFLLFCFIFSFFQS